MIVQMIIFNIFINHKINEDGVNICIDIVDCNVTFF